MSGLRELVGPNCGTANALSGLARGTTDMGAQLQDVRAFGPKAHEGKGPAMPHMDASLHHGPPGGHGPGDAFARAFQQGPQHQLPPMNQPLRDQMVRQFERLQMEEAQAAEFERVFSGQQRHPHMPVHAPPPPGAWAAEFQQQHQRPHPAQMAEMERMYQQAMRPPMAAPGQWAEEFQAQQASAPLEEAWQETAHPAVLQGQEWAAEFETQQTAEAPQGMGMGLDKDMIEQLRNSSDPRWRNSKFLDFLTKVSNGDIEFKDNQAIEKPAAARSEQQGDNWASEFADQEQPAVTQPSEQWAAEFDTQQAASRGDWAAEFQQQEQQAQSTDPAQAWASEYLGDQDDDFKDFDWQAAMAQAQQAVQTPDPEYQFQPNNPYLEHEDPFTEGTQLLSNGELKEAILAFEAAVQRHPEHAEGWRYLGQAQAENEAETPAIAALLACIKHDPYNLEALMMLGVSYTNDLEEARALSYLKRWMENNPDYQGASLKQQQKEVDEYEQFYGAGMMGMDATLHVEVTKMFLNATRINPNDPELHTVLGVLYHISNEFDKAIESFKNALRLKPEDPCLWNKLGATQANSSKSQDAVHAYHRALAIKPNFVRATANLAIAFANQNMHEDATVHYLKALARNPNADHIWSYLRISLSHMGRESLVDLTYRKDPTLFRPYFEF